jgi:hypothetical protein
MQTFICYVQPEIQFRLILVFIYLINRLRNKHTIFFPRNMLDVLVHMRQDSDFISLTAVYDWSLESTRKLFSVSDKKL